MNVNRVENKPNTRFQRETALGLRSRIKDMEGAMIDNAWGERQGTASPDFKLNRAFMVAKAVLAERQGDITEARRLRETLKGVEVEMLGSVRINRQSGQVPELDQMISGFRLMNRLAELVAQRSEVKSSK
jgi:hypothetical protein